MHFMVWVMLRLDAGGSVIIENARNFMHVRVWVMLWWGAGGSRIIVKM